MVAIPAVKIYEFNDHRRKSPLKDRKAGHEGLMRIVKSLGVLSRPQRVLLAIICSACFDNGVFKRSKAWLCKEYEAAYSTICRLLNELESLGFIELDGRGTQFKIFPTQLCYIDDPTELKKEFDLIQKEKLKTDMRVLKNEKKVLENENSTLFSSKNISKNRGKPPSAPPKNEPEKTTQKEPSGNGPFSKNIFGEYEDDIKKSCDSINKLPKKKIPFKPFGLALSLVRSGISPQAISLALTSMVKDWNSIKVNPGKCFEARCLNQVAWLKNKKMINNAKEVELKNNLDKYDGTAFDICNGIGFEMKGINDGNKIY